MDPTLLLAKFWGLLMVSGGVCLGIAMVTNKNLLSLMRSFTENSQNIFLSGFISLLLGSGSLALHHTWGSTNEIIISLIGWMSMLKGAGRIIFTEKIKENVYRKPPTKTKLGFGAVFMLLLGLYLLYIGFEYSTAS